MVAKGGWHHMSRRTIADLEERYGNDTYFSCLYLEVGEGWADLIEEFLKEFKEYVRIHNLEGEVIITQIKQKYGGLTIYYSIMSEDKDVRDHSIPIDEMINYYDCSSAYICERCGADGTMTTIHGYHEVLCPVCKAKVKERLVKYEQANNY